MAKKRNSSRRWLPPFNSLNLMRHSLSTATSAAVGKGDDNLNLVLSVLPVVGDLSKKLADKTKKMDDFSCD